MKCTLETAEVLRGRYMKYSARLEEINSRNPDTTRLAELGDTDHTEWQVCLEVISVLTLLARDLGMDPALLTETLPIGAKP